MQPSFVIDFNMADPYFYIRLLAILVNNSIGEEIIFLPSAASNVPSGSFAIPRKAIANIKIHKTTASIKAFIYGFLWKMLRRRLIYFLISLG